MGTTSPWPFKSDINTMQNTKRRMCAVVLLWADRDLSESCVPLHLENNFVTVVSVMMKKKKKKKEKEYQKMNTFASCTFNCLLCCKTHDMQTGVRTYRQIALVDSHDYDMTPLQMILM